ncbi:flagellar hook-length control protein FliK [Niveibacterium microcysteis]|uniref:Flagellar hook-length control protein FliK n=1 Tax=Niveibacterium microcysteis TaxID=2811415 RepID=A0ABX7M0N0_9RHOO|nr:flagellar hook-length control protein FliK [Niveibacterium microcysteis]
MIPTDLATRLRALLDLPLPQVGSVTPTRSVSPELSPGQRFTAQIAQPLPDGTFKALVAGRSLTLSLPQSVKNGDVLELVVTHSTPQAVFARLLEPAAQEQSKANLSPAARLISQLLTGKESAESPTALNEGNPILQRPPQNGAQLAPLLQRAVAQSGMFYEAHQAQWVEGKLSTAQLLAEPQGRLGQTALPAGPEQSASAQTEQNRVPNEASTQAPSRPVTVAQTNVQTERAEVADAAGRTAASTSEKGLVSQMVPRELAPIVLNQLDALTTQQLTWQGQIWPGQTMEWRIEQPPDDAHGRGADQEPAEWRSSLRVTLPSLGGVEARLFLTSAGVAIHFAADSEASVGRLNAALNELGSALDAVGVPLTGAAVAHETVR